MEKNYITTKEQCDKSIKEHDGVCDRCGRTPVPIETVDNAGNSTFWAGCFHGNDEKDSWGHFTMGTSKEIFDLAEKLVCDGESYYSHTQKPHGKEDTPEARVHYFQTEVSGWCTGLQRINYLKENLPRKSKEEFLTAEYF